MIIPRKHEWFGYLYEHDAKSKEAIDKAFGSFDEPMAFTKEKLLDYNYYRPVAYMDMGCGIPGEVYGAIKKAFEEIDKSSPYDNGLTFNDVSQIEYETSSKGTAIQMKFVSRVHDTPERVVGFVSIESRDGQVSVGDGWEMTLPL